jgi:hypothetical protein
MSATDLLGDIFGSGTLCLRGGGGGYCVYV